MTYQQEAQTWQEMLETLQEVQEMQEFETINNETGEGRRANVVVIRIQLAPSGGPLIGHPGRIIGATGVTRGPSGKSVVPIREVNELTGEVSNGLVVVPEIGSNELEFAFLGKNALRKAGGWLGRQITRLPQIAQRMRGLKALTGGAPCPGCERGFAQQVGRFAPRDLSIKFNRDPNGQWGLSGNYRDASGRMVNIRAGRKQGKFKANLWGQGANGQTFDANLNRDGGDWRFGGHYRDLNGNVVNANGQAGANGFDVNADGNINNNTFNANAAWDGNSYSGHGYLQNQGGSYGGAVSGNPDGFHAQGMVNTGNFNANADVNWQQEMEASVLGEVFREIGI